MRCDLTCADLLGLPNPVSLTTDPATGIVIAAEFNIRAPSQDPSQNPQQLY